MTKNKTVLIVEDELKLAQLIRDYLDQARYETHCLHDGSPVLTWLKNNHADLIILDVMLPNVDGISLCKKIRDVSSAPVIMASAKITETDRLTGLNCGADDYLCKPYSMRELVARVDAMFRRYEIISGNAPSSLIKKKFGPFTLDEQKNYLYFDGEQLSLTTVEFRLLSYLLQHPEISFSRDELLNQIYDDYRFVSDRTIDTHIKNIRRKIQKINSDEEVIFSVYGVGYKLIVPSQS